MLPSLVSFETWLVWEGIRLSICGPFPLGEPLRFVSLVLGFYLVVPGSTDSDSDLDALARVCENPFFSCVCVLCVDPRTG